MAALTRRNFLLLISGALATATLLCAGFYQVCGAQSIIQNLPANIVAAAKNIRSLPIPEIDYIEKFYAKLAMNNTSRLIVC